MCYVGGKIVPYGFTRMVQGGIGLNVGRHVERADWECYNSRVALGYEFVFGEAFDVEKEIGG